ncbi:hypothetical protein CEE45_00065 [Candidatus Heimdallarchaeota archaeon B3_Heim]|nr:MAG: hypothetical protein CEE45_00065 [Candidatus Heimdallarchaeota archaeon B3_Heim]
MREKFQTASNALNQLSNTAAMKAKHISDLVIKSYTQFEEIRYLSETVPDIILYSDNKMANLKESGEIRVAQLLATILCDQITERSKLLIDDLEFGNKELDLRSELLDLREQITRLEEVVQVQNKLANGAPVSTEGIKNLQKKYDSRIQQLERELLRKEGRTLTITALDATKKPKIFGKGKFVDNLADLILEQGKTLRASSGGYISMANLYTSLKNQVPDIKFSLKDLEKACKQLTKQSLIEGVSKQSGIKIVEFTPVALGKDARNIFNLAIDKGYVTFEEVMIHTKWDQQRVMRVLDSLVNQKVARKVSSLDSGDQYYFPGLYGDEEW